MSHEGKLQRGEQWYSNRDQEGKLPDDITNDENKMEDVKYFLDNKSAEPTVKKKPTKKEKTEEEE